MTKLLRLLPFWMLDDVGSLPSCSAEGIMLYGCSVIIVGGDDTDLITTKKALIIDGYQDLRKIH